jgi:ribosomal protein S18 acetylase RimI-like enzyme
VISSVERFILVAAGSGTRALMNQHSIQFRKMTQEEFVEFQKYTLESYAQDIARAFNRPVEEERVRAKEQVNGLLLKGVETEGHFLFNVIDTVSGEKVGNVWVNIDQSKGRAFLYDIVVDKPFRGKGYGRETLVLLEKTLKEMKITSVELHVFADNVVALSLYRAQGYNTGSFNLQKNI